jgi:hypothetical protein
MIPLPTLSGVITQLFSLDVKFLNIFQKSAELLEQRIGILRIIATGVQSIIKTP